MLHANKLISAVLQVLMSFCFLTLPRQEVCHHVQSEPLAFPNPHANGGNRTHLPHLEKSTANLTKSVGKSTDFGEISHRFGDNQPPTLGKSATDFGKIRDRLWENQRPTLGKSATDFGKISHRLWENQRPTLGKSAIDFGKISHGLWENELRRRMEIRNRLF